MPKTRKNIKKKYGGFFFNKPKVESSECDINNLSNLLKDTGDGEKPLIKMHNNYKKCCPKDYLRRKNSSPYCKQLEMNFKSLSTYENDIAGYYGDETDLSKIKQIMNEPNTGGKTRKKKKSNRKNRRK